MCFCGLPFTPLLLGRSQCWSNPSESHPKSSHRDCPGPSAYASESSWTWRITVRQEWRTLPQPAVLHIRDEGTLRTQEWLGLEQLPPGFPDHQRTDTVGSKEGPLMSPERRRDEYRRTHLRRDPECTGTAAKRSPTNTAWRQNVARSILSGWAVLVERSASCSTLLSVPLDRCRFYLARQLMKDSCAWHVSRSGCGQPQ